MLGQALLIAYSVMPRDYIPEVFFRLVDKPLFRILLLIVMVQMCKKDPVIGVLMAVAYAVTLIHINERYITEGFLSGLAGLRESFDDELDGIDPDEKVQDDSLKIDTFRA